METEIYIATHKLTKTPNNKNYIPIQVGSINNKQLYNTIDSSRDNISNKNQSFCELTALYWMWKNSTAENIGLVHYRRYFFLGLTNRLEKVLSNESIKKYLNYYDVIIPKKTYILKYKNVYDSYKANHNIKDYKNCRKIISKIYPNYISSFDKVSNRRYFYAYNMFITKKNIFDEYCKWLFNILFELEKITDTSNYSNYNKRIYGFLAERLFNVWLDYQQLNVKEINVWNTENNIIPQIMLEKFKNLYLLHDN